MVIDFLSIFLSTAEALQCQVELIEWLAGLIGCVVWWLNDWLLSDAFLSSDISGSAVDLKLKLSM